MYGRVVRYHHLPCITFLQDLTFLRCERGTTWYISLYLQLDHCYPCSLVCVCRLFRSDQIREFFEQIYTLQLWTLILYLPTENNIVSINSTTFLIAKWTFKLIYVVERFVTKRNIVSKILVALFWPLKNYFAARKRIILLTSKELFWWQQKNNFADLKRINLLTSKE